MNQLERFGVSMDKNLLEAFDKVIQAKGYSSRSEAIRDLVRDLLVREQWQQDAESVVGAITIVYDHHARLLEEKLTDIQHEFAEQIHASMHVHLDERHCVEVVIVSGRASDVKRLADLLGSIKGVRHCQLTATGVAWDTEKTSNVHHHHSDHAHG